MQYKLVLKTEVVFESENAQIKGFVDNANCLDYLYKVCAKKTTLKHFYYDIPIFFLIMSELETIV
jgi:hypothetical protein